MKDMIWKINKSYCPKLVKEMMDKYQLDNYGELYDKLVEEIEKWVAKSRYDMIPKKVNRGFDMYEKYTFVQNCLDEKEAVITREYYDLGNIVSNINELSENNVWEEIG